MTSFSQNLKLICIVISQKTVLSKSLQWVDLFLVRCVFNTAKHGVACDQLEPCKKWHRHPQILFGVFKSVGGQFLESKDRYSQVTNPSIHIYIYISTYPSILKNSKNPFLVYNRDSQKHENVKEPARDLSVLSENC